ncbi:MAG: desulfoferrodoxin Dfx [Clostridiales bacterium]|nr:desulfoferrodoxin Dfx [Clostridiales bacterium]
MKIFKGKCGNIVVKLVEAECQEGHAEEIIPNTTDAAGEKHVPVIEKDGSKVTVKVGEVEHPMLEAHYIMFIALETNKGYSVRHLNPGDKPVAEFALTDGEEVVAAYEYCNLHGLWKA